MPEAAMGWACLATPEGGDGGSCEVEATRAFALDGAYAPGSNLVASPGRYVLKPGGEATLALFPR